jgi:hypothetical protein
MKLFVCCIVLLMSLQKCKVKNSNDSMSNLQVDTLTSVSEFKLMVDSTLKKMHNANQITTVEDAVLLAKIYNSIASYGLVSQEPYSLFYTKFNEGFMNRISEVLECKLSIGMGFYCEKYKLIVGGTKYPKGSYIVVLELQK